MSPETLGVVLRTLNLEGYSNANEAHGGVLVSVVRHAVADLEILVETQEPRGKTSADRERVFLALQGLLGRLEAGLDAAYAVQAEVNKGAAS